MEHLISATETRRPMNAKCRVQNAKVKRRNIKSCDQAKSEFCNLNFDFSFSSLCLRGGMYLLVYFRFFKNLFMSNSTISLNEYIIKNAAEATTWPLIA